MRQVNDVVAASFGPGEWMEVLCECGSPNCTRLVALNRDDYDAVRSEAGQFIVGRDHDVVAHSVVDRRRSYDVVASRVAQPA